VGSPMGVWGMSSGAPGSWAGPLSTNPNSISNPWLSTGVVRNDGPRSTPPPHVAAVTERSSTLRADASEFVPRSIVVCAD
jgi:hypothetical protein